jgi:hypothetical protein
VFGAATAIAGQPRRNNAKATAYHGMGTAVHGFPPKDHYRPPSPSINKGFFAGRNGLGESRTRAWHVSVAIPFQSIRSRPLPYAFPWLRRAEDPRSGGRAGKHWATELNGPTETERNGTHHNRM